LAEWLGPRRERWSILHGWVQGAALVRLAGAAAGGRAGLGSFEGWAVDRALGSAMAEIGLEQPVAWRSVELVRALLALPPGALEDVRGIEAGAPGGWFDEPAVRSASGWNAHEGVAWVNREAYLELLDALAARDSVAGSADAFAARETLGAAIEASGYRVTPVPQLASATEEPVVYLDAGSELAADIGDASTNGEGTPQAADAADAVDTGGAADASEQEQPARLA
jgi:hypothetical protein